MAFTGMPHKFNMGYNGLQLKEHVPRTQGSKCLERDWLEHHGERLLKRCKMFWKTDKSTYKRIA